MNVRKIRSLTDLDDDELQALMAEEDARAAAGTKH
jgi:hypothetical protein